jgi:hypothetical protein
MALEEEAGFDFLFGRRGGKCVKFSWTEEKLYGTSGQTTSWKESDG